MADRSNFFIMQLFHEMKQRFPAIPDRVVSECIRQNFNDKKICEAILTVKNRNFSRRQFPSAQAANMLPTAANEESAAVGANETSTTESETESSRCEDDVCVTSETEETEFSDSKEPPDPCAIDLNATMPSVSTRAAPSTFASNIIDDTDSQCRDPIKISDVRDAPTSFGPPLSLEGCGRGFGGGCCCRHGEELELLRHYGDCGDIVNMVEGVVPLRGGDSDAPLLDRNDVAFDILDDGDMVKFGQGAPRKSSAANAPPHTSASIPGVRLPGVLPPPSSQVPNIEDLTYQASLLNLSSPPPSVHFVDPGFNYHSRIPESRPPKGACGTSYIPSAEHLPHGVPLSPPFKPRMHDQNVGQYEDSFLEEPLMTSHDLEDFSFNVNCRLKTSGVGSHFLDEEDERRMELGSKGKTSASSTVKLTTTSPAAPPLSRKNVSPQGLQPTPVFAGHRQFRSTKESPTPPGRPVSPSNFANATASPSASQLIETPLSYTSVNLTVRQPSSDPLPPIDIRSSVGDSSVYTSSCFPQQSFQSELQIRIGGSAGISGGSGYAPMSPSWKSQQASPKNQTASQSPQMSQRRPHDHSPSHLAPEGRGAAFHQNSPQTSRRENVERPRSLYGPSSLASMGKTQAQASGSLPDVSKARSFAGDHEKVPEPGARNTAVHYQPDVRSRPPASVPSSPATGLPPPGPLPASNSPKERPRLPANASSSFEGHSQATCSDVSRCKALLVHQMERKNLLERELNCEREKLKSMQEQTHLMERDLRLRQMQQRCHASLPIIQKVHALRQEIKFLQEECKKMAQAVDLNSDIQVPLGETDEEFYKNIYTGQRGWVLVPRADAQPHEPQISATFHQESREQWRRRRENPAPPGMEPPGGAEGVHVRAEPVGSTRMGPSTSSEGPNWMCSSCTFHNHPALDKCEQCEMPRIMLGMAMESGSVVSKTPCYCHPNCDVPERPVCLLPPNLLPKSLPPLTPSQQVVGSAANLDAPSC